MAGVFHQAEGTKHAFTSAVRIHAVHVLGYLLVSSEGNLHNKPAQALVPALLIFLLME